MTKKLNKRQKIVYEMLKVKKTVLLEEITEQVRAIEGKPSITEGAINACIKNLSFVLASEGWNQKIIRTTPIGRGRKAIYELIKTEDCIDQFVNKL